MATPRTLRIFAGRPSVLVNSKSCRTVLPDDLKLHVTELPSCVGGVKTVYLAGALWKIVRLASSKLPALTRDEIISVVVAERGGGVDVGAARAAGSPQPALRRRSPTLSVRRNAAVRRLPSAKVLRRRRVLVAFRSECSRAGAASGDWSCSRDEDVTPTIRRRGGPGWWASSRANSTPWPNAFWAPER